MKIQPLVQRFAAALVLTMAAIHGTLLWGANKEPVIVVVHLNGTLEVKRSPSTKAFKAVVGTVLKPGDVLLLSGEAQVTCSDLGLHTIPDGVPSPIPCASTATTLYFNNEEIPTTRAATGFVPIVLSPRKTKLQTTRPLLSWKGLPGVNDYELHVTGDNPSWSKQVTGTTPRLYPADAPSLKPGITYQFWVSQAGSRDRDETPGLGFSIATDEERESLKADRAQLSNAGLDPAMKALMDAAILDSCGFHSEAIDDLQQIASTSGLALVHRMLSNSYYSVGLYREALIATQKAFDLYTGGANVDTAGAAWAKLHSGLLYSQLGNKAQAATDLKDAKSRFAALGFDDQVTNIQEFLNALNQ
jgi:hypothetical protein